MRTIEQIEAEIIQATQQKAEITNRIRALETEKRATVQAQFEADKNVRVIRDKWGVKTIDASGSELGRRALAVELGSETDTANWMTNNKPTE